MADVSSWTVFFLSLIMASCSGLGSVPFFFVSKLSPWAAGICHALACGVMLAASFDLIHEGQPYGPWLVLTGVALGAVFIKWMKGWLDDQEDVTFHDLKGADARKTLLMVGIMIAHAFGEGMGVGVSFCGQKGWSQGLTVTVAIGVHNIPEGLAVATVLMAKGVKLREASLWSFLTAMPQALVALPSYLFVKYFQACLPVAVGFAAGSMIWMVFAELLPDALGEADASDVASFATGAALLLEGVRMAVESVVPSSTGGSEGVIDLNSSQGLGAEGGSIWTPRLPKGLVNPPAAPNGPLGLIELWASAILAVLPALLVAVGGGMALGAVGGALPTAALLSLGTGAVLGQGVVKALDALLRPGPFEPHRSFAVEMSHRSLDVKALTDTYADYLSRKDTNGIGVLRHSALFPHPLGEGGALLWLAVGLLVAHLLTRYLAGKDGPLKGARGAALPGFGDATLLPLSSDVPVGGALRSYTSGEAVVLPSSRGARAFYSEEVGYSDGPRHLHPHHHHQNGEGNGFGTARWEGNGREYSATGDLDDPRGMDKRGWARNATPRAVLSNPLGLHCVLLLGWTLLGAFWTGGHVVPALARDHSVGRIADAMLPVLLAAITLSGALVGLASPWVARAPLRLALLASIVPFTLMAGAVWNGIYAYVAKGLPPALSTPDDAWIANAGTLYRDKDLLWVLTLRWFDPHNSGARFQAFWAGPALFLSARLALLILQKWQGSQVAPAALVLGLAASVGLWMVSEFLCLGTSQCLELVGRDL